MEKKNYTKYSDEDQVIKNTIDRIKNYPIHIQRLNYFNSTSKNSYSYLQITEDDDKIVLVEKTKGIKFGNNGVYEYLMNENGVIYTKKGRTSSRLKFFYTTRKDAYHYLITLLVKYMGSTTALTLLNDKIFEYSITMTKGLYSSIISDKITTIEGCMKYYATYSLRGIKINDKNKGTSLYNFCMHGTNSRYHCGLILRSTHDVNELLDIYTDIKANKDLLKTLKSKYEVLYQLDETFLALNKKIDWVHIKDIHKEFAGSFKKEFALKTQLFALWDRNGVLLDFNIPATLIIQPTFNQPKDLPF